MKIAKYVFVGLMVLTFGTSITYCQDFTSPGFEDIQIADDDNLMDPVVHWDDVSFTGDYDTVRDSVMTVDTGEGSLNEEALVALLTELENRLSSGQSLSGEITIDGKSVLLSSELKRQQEIWEEASKRILVSPDPSQGLVSMTDTDFVDNAGLDSSEFNALFNSVVDSDVLAEKETSGEKIVQADDYRKVGNLYKALSDDIFAYNNSRFLAANSSDYEVTSKAKASTVIIEQRMKSYVVTLKRVLIKG